MNPFDTDGSKEEEQSLKKKPGAKSQPSVHRGFPKLRLKKKKAKKKQPELLSARQFQDKPEFKNDNSLSTTVGKTENKGSANPNTLDKTAYGKENKPATAPVSASEKIGYVVTNETRPGKEDKKSTNPFDDDSDEEDQIVPRRNAEPQRKVHSVIGQRERGIDISDLEKGESQKSKSLSFSPGVPIVRSSTRKSQKDEQGKHHTKENTARVPDNVLSVDKGDTEKPTIIQHIQKVHYTQAPDGIGARAKERISSDSAIRPPVDTGNETSQTENITETNDNEKGNTKKPKSLSFSRGISKVRSSFGKGHKSQKRPESLPEKAISETTTIRNNEQENIYVKEKKQEAKENVLKNPFDDSADEEDDFVPEINEEPHQGEKTVTGPIESEITADKNNVETKKPKALSFSRGISKVRSSFGKGHKSHKRDDHAENLTEKATSEAPTIGSETIYTKENIQETQQSLPTVKLGNTKTISTSTVYSIHKRNQIPIDDDDDEEDEPIQRKIIEPQKKVQSPTDQFQTENAADTNDVEKGETKKPKSLSFSKGISKVRSSFGKGHKSQKRPESLTEKATPETPTIRNNDKGIYTKENRQGGVRESLPAVDTGIKTMVTPIQSTPKVHSTFKKTRNPFDDDEDEPDPRIIVEPQKKVPTQTDQFQTENAEDINDVEKGETKKPKALSFSRGISKVRSSFGKGLKQSPKRPESLTEKTIIETPRIEIDEQEHIFTKESKQGGVRETLHTVDTGNKRMDISIRSTPMVQSSYRTSQNTFDDDEDDEPDVRINLEPQKKSRAQIVTFQTENSVGTNDVETKSFSRGFSKVRASFGKGHKGQKSPEILTETAILETPAVKSNEQEDVYDKENRQAGVRESLPTVHTRNKTIVTPIQSTPKVHSTFRTTHASNPVDDDDDEEDEFVDPRINVEPHKNVQAQIGQSQTENTEDINDVEKGEPKKSKTLSLSRSISKVRSSFGKGQKSQKRPESLSERTISETPAFKSGPPEEREQILVKSELSPRASEGRQNNKAEMRVSPQEQPVKSLMEEEPRKRNSSIQSTTLNPIGEDERRVSSTIYENINETDETNTTSKPFQRGISKLRSPFKRKSKNLQKEGQQDMPPESPVKTKEMESPVEKEIIPLVEEHPTQGRQNGMAEMKVSRQEPPVKLLMEEEPRKRNLSIQSTTLNPIGEDERRVSSTVYENIYETDETNTASKPFQRGISKLRSPFKRKSKNLQKEGQQDMPPESPVKTKEMESPPETEIIPSVGEPPPQRRLTVTEVLADLGYTPDGIEINSTENHSEDTLKKQKRKSSKKKSKKDKKHGKGEEDEQSTVPLMEGTMEKGDVSPPVAEPLPQGRPTVEEVLADLGFTPDGIEINSTETNEDDTPKGKPSKKKSKKTKKDKKEEDNVTEPLMERRANSDLTPEELFPKMASPFGKVETSTRHHPDRGDMHLTLNPFDDITEEENEEDEGKVKTHKGNAVSYAVKRKLTILRAPFKRSKSQSNETADESPESPAGNQDILPRNESQGDTGECKFIQPEPPVKRQLTEEEVLFDHGFTPERINPNSPEEESINRKSKKKKKMKKQDKAKDEDVTEPLMAQISTERANEPYVKIINPGQSSSKMSPTKDQLIDMRTTVDDVKGVLTENLQKLEERAGNLDELETRADDLALKTTQFVKVSVEVKHEMKSRNCRWKLIIGVSIAFFILMIVLVIIIVTVTKQSDSTPTKALVNVNATRTT